MALEAHLGQNVLDIFREAVDICPEVVLDILSVSPQGFESEFAGVVKSIAGGFAQEAVLHRQMPDFLAGLQNLAMGCQQAVVKTLNDRHRQNDQPILMRFVCAIQRIGDIPYHRRLFLNIMSD